MAKYELGSTVSDKIRKKMMQYEAVTGRAVPPDVIRAMMEGEVSALAQGARAERALDIQQGYLDLNEEAAKKEAQASTISGIGELAVGGSQIYRNLFPKGLTKQAIQGASGVTGGAVGIGQTGLSALPSFSTAAKGSVLGEFGYPSAISSGVGSFGPSGAPALTSGASLAPEAGIMATGVEGTAPALTAGGALGALGAGAAGGLAGGWLGQQKSFQEITPWGGEKTERKLGGTLGGAAAGALAGSIIPGVGTVLGGLIGGVTGFVESTCIIVTTCTDKDSPEVQTAREFRDKYLDTTTLRGYYMIAEKIVPLLKQDESFKKMVKEELVDKLIEFGEWSLGKRSTLPSQIAFDTTSHFLAMCNALGNSQPSFTRSNGEVV